MHKTLGCCLHPNSFHRWCSLLQHLFPELGVSLEERAYGADCRLWLPEEKKINFSTIKATLFDEFVVAHTLGWWCAFIAAVFSRDFIRLLDM